MKSSVTVSTATLYAFACGLGLLPAFALAAESPLSQAINRLNSDTRQQRVIELKDLGIDRPIVLSATDARRELYLPVPAEVPLTDATLNFEASYLNADAGHNTLLLSLDGYPVRALGLNEAEGSASVAIGVDKAARDSGSVRLGVAWSSQSARVLCADDRAIGQVLRIDPHTRLSYSYDGEQLHNIGAAWNTLPAKPGILVAPGPLSSASYDAAWRLGVALERIGKQARILAFPALQDSIDLAQLHIPDEFKSIPAFASLDGKGLRTLTDPAQIGALLMLGQLPALKADLAISDPQLLKAIKEPLDALASQVQHLDPAAGDAMNRWRERHANTALNNQGSDTVRLSLLGAYPVLMINQDAAKQAINLFSSAWNTLARNRQLTMAETASPPLSEDGRMALTRLGGKPGALDVLEKTDWSTSFPLASVAYDGRVPVKAVIDVAASPGVSATPPVVTLFFNDYLIGARQLDAQGQQERIEGRIPRYALAAQNTLRVAFQRQPVSEHCKETPQAFAVSILPTSHVTLGKITTDNDFSGLAARFAVDTQVLVPQRYLDHPASSLPQVIHIASASGVSPLRAQLSVSTDEQTTVTADRAFLAFEVAVKDSTESVKTDGQGHLLIQHRQQTLLDLKSLNRLAVLQVVESASQHGLSYRTLGNQPPEFARPLLLGRGSVTILGDSGPLSTFDTQDPSGSQLIDNEEPKGLDAWRKPSWLWLIPGAVLVVLLFLLAGRRARRNRQ